MPSNQPTGQPSDQPSSQPSAVSSNQPTGRPSVQPSNQPSGLPSGQPSQQPSGLPSNQPTGSPSKKPSSLPTPIPSTTSPTARPTVGPTLQAVIVKVPLLNPEQTVQVASVSAALAFVVICAADYIMCFSAKAVEKRKKASRLRELPVHRALLGLKPVLGPRLLELIEAHKDTVMQTDLDGDTVLDIILHKKTKTVVSEDVLYVLLLDYLPFDVLTGEPINDVAHSKGWTACIQSDEDSVVSVVDQVLTKFRLKIKLLAGCTDTSGRKAVEIAGPRCKILILRRLFLFERFEINEGPPEHCSATSMVLLAKDHHESLQSLGTDEAIVGPNLVALKFMRNANQFSKEVLLRRDNDFDNKFVIPMLMYFQDPVEGVGFDWDKESDEINNMNKMFREDSILKGYGEYPFCVVLEAGSQSLKRLIDHDRIAANEWDSIKHITRSLAVVLQHIHGKGVVHGDLKPLNVMLVGTAIELIDLDASASYTENEPVGMKYSSGYIAPEMLVSDEDGVAKVREGDPFQDMWALGCILYYLSCAQSLFHVNTDDNLGSPEDHETLLNWDMSTKEKKMSLINNKLAKNLVSLLLNKDQTKRPDAAHVLSHPFLTGQRVSRLQGDKADWDIFLSYRVASDSAHVEVFHKHLTDLGLKVLWDKLCLLPGQNWEEGFCSGLLRSANFVCLLSKGAIRNPTNDRSNFEKLTVSSSCDNVLLEWRLALELKERGMIDGVFPVMIGEKGIDGSYSNFFGSGCNPVAPATHVESVEHKLREHLDREGLGLPLQDTMTVSTILGTVLSNQGGFIEGDFADKLTSVCQAIKTMVTLSLTQVDTSPKKTLAKVFRQVVSIVRTQKVITASGQLSPSKEISRLQRELVSKERDMEDMKTQLSGTNEEKMRIETEKRTILDEKARIEVEKSACEQENAQLHRLLEAASRRSITSVIGTAEAVVLDVQEDRSAAGLTEGGDLDDIELGEMNR